MKLKLLKLSLTCLTLLITGVGCEKNDKNYNPDSIIGKWEWLYSKGGIIGITYPEEGQTVEWEFTKDSTLIITENDVTTFETIFYISNDTLIFFRETDVKYRIEIEKDTLSLYFIVEGFDNFYKRID